jgi:hypothetical protein
VSSLAATAYADVVSRAARTQQRARSAAAAGGLPWPDASQRGARHTCCEAVDDLARETTLVTTLCRLPVDPVTALLSA